MTIFKLLVYNIVILGFWEIISKMWTDHSQVDLTKNLNMFSDFLSLYCINRYVGQKIRLNSYVARVLDKDMQSPSPIPLRFQDKL